MLSASKVIDSVLSVPISIVLVVSIVISPSPSKFRLPVPSVKVKLSLTVHIICSESKFSSSVEELPIWIVLDPFVPISIFTSTLSLPIASIPDDEFNVRESVQSKFKSLLETIFKSVPSPVIYSPESPNWICIPEFKSNPVSGTCVNVISLSAPKESIVLSSINLKYPFTYKLFEVLQYDSSEKK